MSQRHTHLGSSDEKYDVKVDQVENSSTDVVDVIDEDGELLLPERRQHAERKLVRKLDFRLLPTIVLIFILNYIDVGICRCCCSHSINIKASARPYLPLVSKA